MTRTLPSTHPESVPKVMQTLKRSAVPGELSWPTGECADSPGPRGSLHQRTFCGIKKPVNTCLACPMVELIHPNHNHPG